VETFSWRSLSPVCANLNGEYPQVDWSDMKFDITHQQQQWNGMIRGEAGAVLNFPPLAHSASASQVFVLFVVRLGSRMKVCGGFNERVSRNIAAVEVTLMISLTIERHNKPSLRGVQQRVVKMEHSRAENEWPWPVLMRFFKVPWNDFLATAPPVSMVTMIKVSSSELLNC